MPRSPAKIELPQTDAIVVGSGPNGLAAAIRLAQAGKSVVVLEAAATPGGGTRSAELTLPGFVHDVCASVFAMGVCSPFFSTLPLEKFGLEWIAPPAALAHPFTDGTAALLYRDVRRTSATLGQDGQRYCDLMRPFVRPELLRESLAPLRLPRSPLLLARFGLQALRSAASLARGRFQTGHGRAFFAGLAAHSIIPLEQLSTAAAGLVLAVAAHLGGWPFARGGSQQFAAALVRYLESLGGRVITGCAVQSLDQLPHAPAILLDITPRQLIRMAGSKLPPAYVRKLERYRYGPAVYKIDWALHHPIPWRAAECAQAGTLHLGDSLEEICRSESACWQGLTTDHPYVLLAQPSLFDPGRAPAGKHTAWAYCHVPHGFQGDVTAAIESQVERFAPGFRDCIAARSILKPADLEQRNPNIVGGDIAGGAATLDQLFFRPTASLYRVPIHGVYLCSSSTPPGPGVHGMCGYFAAQASLSRL